MPIPFKLPISSPLISPITQALLDLSKSKAPLTIDAAWLRHHGLGDYPSFERDFLAQLRLSVRARFVTEKKTDEFAIEHVGKILAFVTISLADLGTGIRIATAE